jgi:hypothetical protein
MVMKRIGSRATGCTAALLVLAVASPSIATDIPPPERNPVHALKPALDGLALPADFIPLPERRPAGPAAETAQRKEEPAPASWTEAEITAAKAECAKLTKGLSVQMRYVAPIRQGQCGTAQPVEVSSIGSGQKVTLVPPAIMNCRMVAMLTRWLDTSVQPKAKAMLGRPIVRLTNASAYVCRNRYNAKDQKLSEHAKANALDVSGFVTSEGREIAVVTFWGPTMAEIEAKQLAQAEKAAAATIKPQQTASSTSGAGAAPADASAWAASAEPTETATTAPPLPEPSKGKVKGKSKLLKPAGLGALVKGEPLIATGSQADRKRKRGTLLARPAAYAPKTPEGKFLHAVHADACETFGTVLGPEANQAHHDHFHLDLASRRGSNFCQ